MKITNAIRAPAVFATASLFHFTASIQPYGSNFAVAPPGAPAVDGAFEITRFGPAGCISTWKNQASHCVIRTECNNQTMMDYTIRLICVDKGNERVRHVFGKGSFDPQETFDTLVVCEQCTAEEAVQQGPAPAPAPVEPPTGPVPYGSFAASADVAKLSATVQTLSTEVHELTVSMASNAESVKKLENAVFGAGTSQGAAQTIMAMPIQAGTSQGAAQTIMAMPIQAGGSQDAVQTPTPATPIQALPRRAEGQRIVLRKRRLVKQQRKEQKKLEETLPIIDETTKVQVNVETGEQQKPTQQQLDAAEDRVQAGSFTDAEDSNAVSGDSQMENGGQGSVDFVTDNTYQRAEDEEEPEDGAADTGEYNQDDQE